MLLHDGVQAFVVGGWWIGWAGRGADCVQLEPVLDPREGVRLAWLAVKHLPFVLGPMAGEEMLPDLFCATEQTVDYLEGNPCAPSDGVLALLLDPFAFGHSSFFFFFFSSFFSFF